MVVSSEEITQHTSQPDDAEIDESVT